MHKALDLIANTTKTRQDARLSAPREGGNRGGDQKFKVVRTL